MVMQIAEPVRSAEGAREPSLSPEAATDMLRPTFWSRLSSPDVRNDSRHKFDSGELYEGLVMYVRSLQFEVRPTKNLKSKTSLVNEITSDETNKKIDQLCAGFKDLNEDLRDISDRVNLKRKVPHKRPVRLK